jgi:hypothetical protein
MMRLWPLPGIEEATGTSYTEERSLFPARGMRGQALAFYTVRHPASPPEADKRRVKGV